MAVFFIILRQELKLNFRHLERVLANFLFFLIFVSCFFLLAQNQENRGFDASVIIWISLLSCLIFSAAEFLKRDFEDGSVEQILLSCENFEVFIFAKMLANWMVCCLPILLASALINFEKEFLLLLIVASLTINFICCFCGSLSMLGNSAPIIAAIALPLIIPTLLISYGDFWVSLKLLSGICVFLGSILIFATAKIVKIAID